MFSQTNIKFQLEKYRAARIAEEVIMSEVKEIFSQNEKERDKILNTLKNETSDNSGNDFNFDLLDGRKIYHLEDIKKLCIDYRLRFLDSHYFKGEIPEEAVSRIRDLENNHQTSI